MIPSIIGMRCGVYRRATVVKPAAQRMQPSVFRRLQLATFAFLALVVVALLISAALTAREAWRLRQAQAELDRFYQFDRMQLVITRRLTTMVEGTPAGPRGQPLLSGVIDRMIALSSDPETPVKLN